MLVFSPSPRLAFSHNERTHTHNPKLTISLKMEIVPRSRGWVSNPLSMMDCFTTGILFSKRRKTIFDPRPMTSAAEFPAHKHAHTASWFTSTVRQPSASRCFHYLFISCLRMPALPHHPSCSPPWSFLTRREGGGHQFNRDMCPFPRTHDHYVLHLKTAFMNIHEWLAATPGLCSFFCVHFNCSQVPNLKKQQPRRQ